MVADCPPPGGAPTGHPTAGLSGTPDKSCVIDLYYLVSSTLGFIYSSFFFFKVEAEFIEWRTFYYISNIGILCYKISLKYCFSGISEFLICFQLHSVQNNFHFTF